MFYKLSNLFFLAVFYTFAFCMCFIAGAALFYFSVLFLTIFFFGFGYGSIVTLNCMYDESVPQTFQSKVLGKRISSGKTTTYYLELAAWGVQTENDDVSVSEELYERIEIDDNVNVYLKKGLIEIPWFIVTE